MKHINEQQYKEEVLTSQGLVLLDFFATWCGPCRMLSPELEELEQEQNILVFKMDVDECQAVPREYGVMSIPTVCIFKDGVFQEKFTGYRTKDDILELLRKYM